MRSSRPALVLLLATLAVPSCRHADANASAEGGAESWGFVATLGTDTTSVERVTREGDHVTIELPISVTEAALGAKVEVPTLSEGTVILSIPPGTSSGAKLRLKGKGIINRKTGEHGDQFVQLKIVLPGSLSPKARELFEQLSQELPPVAR